MSAINFNRSPFLADALEFIRRNPGCTKRAVAYYDRPSLPSRTVSYRCTAINRLLAAKLVRNYERGGRYHLLAIDGPRIADYEIVNHGIIYPDYFPGCGVSGTQFDCVATGIGDNAAEAIDDCIEQMATMAVLEYRVDRIREKNAPRRKAAGVATPSRRWSRR